MSSTQEYQQQNFWETPDLSLLSGYLDKQFKKELNKKYEKAKIKNRAEGRS